MPIVAVGLVLAVAFFTVANTSYHLFSPGVYILLVLLLAPVLIRTIRLTAHPEAAGEGAGYLFRALFASFGVAVLAGLASAIAFCMVCSAVAIIEQGTLLFRGNAPLIVGGVAGLAIFVLVFVRLWPRQKPGSRPPSPDSEN